MKLKLLKISAFVVGVIPLLIETTAMALPGPPPGPPPSMGPGPGRFMPPSVAGGGSAADPISAADPVLAVDPVSQGRRISRAPRIFPGQDLAGLEV